VPSAENSHHILDIQGLSINYNSVHGRVYALEDVNFVLDSGEFVAIVGESGSGKSTLALGIIGLLPQAATITGKILYKNNDLAQIKKKDWINFRGREIGMIFQEPMTSLDPIEKVDRQLTETLLVIKKKDGGSETVVESSGQISNDSQATVQKTESKKQYLHEQVNEWLRKVRIADPESVAQRYPFQLSGGMIQRVMIAMALSLSPSLLIADEPTTALDVTTQAQILKLMKSLVDQIHMTIVLITHDLGVAAQVADRIVVLYAGEVVEEGTVKQIFENPLHPYTQGLLKCYPKSAETTDRLQTLSGSVPDLRSQIKGCKFADRCPFVVAICRQEKPRYIEAEANHHAKCVLYY
jgi:oligopeptide/dipeptide ABC transporter ATP-binding protein